MFHLELSQNCETQLLASSCLSVCLSLLPRGTTRRQLDGILYNLVLEYFSKKTVKKLYF
jgi:hypothetical protein